MSIADGSTGTMMVSARRTSSLSSVPCTRAGASMTRTSVVRATLRMPSSYAGTPPIAGKSAGRCASQSRLERCGS